MLVRKEYRRIETSVQIEHLRALYHYTHDVNHTLNIT
jgi:hypothetical protein